MNSIYKNFSISEAAKLTGLELMWLGDFKLEKNKTFEVGGKNTGFIAKDNHDHNWLLKQNQDSFGIDYKISLNEFIYTSFVRILEKSDKKTALVFKDNEITLLINDNGEYSVDRNVYISHEIFI